MGRQGTHHRCCRPGGRRHRSSAPRNYRPGWFPVVADQGVTDALSGTKVCTGSLRLNRLDSRHSTALGRALLASCNGQGR
jgi:hypothetical protein